MKKIRIILIFFAIILTFFLVENVFASEEETKLLYQDITINKDGSITVKEAAWLNGEYNGRFRNIDFRNIDATTFTGIYSNFTGNTDIYDGKSIRDIAVYDISQNNFHSIEDVNNKETIYKQVSSASNGDYGVYELDTDDYGADFKIYCPDSERKVICIEYTITDAVVIHNDIAELYWNVLGDYFEEDINDFKVLVHLPGEDNDVRVWTHGPLTGRNEIIDSKTLYFEDNNVDNYTPETIRVMFNKDLVPYGSKKSNVDGKENILKYEEIMADEANSEREKAKLEQVNKASQAVIDLEKLPRMYYYNTALELVNGLDDTNELKQEFLDRIEKTKGEVNEEWKKELRYSLESLIENKYLFLNEQRLEDFKEEIEEGFDKETKEQYLVIYEQLKNILEEKRANQRKIFTNLVVLSNLTLGIFAIYKLIKILKEKNKFKGRYYRDFPSEDNPNVLEYLMKRKSTNVGFSATILNLINKKVISYEKNPKDKDITLVLVNEIYKATEAESVVINILFKVVGKDKKCSIEALKNYGKKASTANWLIKKINQFKDATKKEANSRQYFKKDTTIILYKTFVLINYIFSLFMSIGVFLGLQGYGFQITVYILGVTLLNAIYLIIGIKDKNRTLEGKEQYSKWLAHKRFLKDFSNFEEKDLPEIALWEKYLVTATVLGCADKVEKTMKMHITDTSQIDNNLLVYQSINLNLTSEINSSVKTAVTTSASSISTSSYSSGGGFGGGSSGGGGRRRPEAAVEVVSKI